MKFKEGRVYRTRDLKKLSSNPTRLAQNLVQEGKLRKLRNGLFYVPKKGTFGDVPPSEDAILKALFGSNSYLKTGPSVWNSLGLGTTAVEAIPLIYNKSKTGLEQIGRKKFEFRRVRFPRKPSKEFFVVDLLQNLDRAGADPGEMKQALGQALRNGRFDGPTLLEMAEKYGSKSVEHTIMEVTAGTY